jgi:hypothetical protein
MDLHRALTGKPYSKSAGPEIVGALRAAGWPQPRIEIVIANIGELVEPVISRHSRERITKVKHGFSGTVEKLFS